MSGAIENGIIESADIVIERGFVLTCWITLTFDGSGQGFGGYVLGGSPFDYTSNAAKHQDQPNIAADFIGGVLSVAGVERFSDLRGKVVRVQRDEPFGKIIAIGHPVKDIWYRPDIRMALLTKGGAA